MIHSIIAALFIFTMSCVNSVTKNETQSKVNSSGNVVQEIKAGTETIAFYNVENLFDIYDDPDKDDKQFLPDSEKEWTEERYNKKLKDIAKVIAAIDSNGLPAIVGLVEVENRKVCEDLAAQNDLKAANYKIVHEESPDERGIDVAMLYNASVFDFDSYEALRINFPNDIEQDLTRDILYVKGKLNGIPFNIFVNHFPSRSEGQEESEPKRVYVASVLREKIDQILNEDPNANILVMGDFNDLPDNKSIREILKADNSGKAGSLYNTALPQHEKDEWGTYRYKGDWQMLDQIMVTNNLSDAKNPVHLVSDELNILHEKWMLFYNKQYEEYNPNRTYGGPKYYGGYSDHLPVFVQLEIQ